MRKETRVQAKVILLLICMTACVFLTIQTSSAQETEINLLYISEEVEDWRDDSFQTALELDPIFSLHHYRSAMFNFSSYSNGSELLVEYDLVCLLDVVLTPANLTVIKEFVEAGGGLIILCGDNITANPEIFVSLEIIESYDIGNVTLSTEIALSTGTNSTSPLERNIDWNSCPETQNYTSFGDTISSSFSGDSLIVKRPRDDSSVTTLDPLVFTKNLGTGRVGVISYWLEGQDNIQLLLWAYYNYFAYCMTWITLNQPNQIEQYALWKFSPVPHTLSQIIITSIMVLLVFLTIITIINIRKRSNKTRDSLEEISFQENNNQQKEDVKKNSRKKIFRPRKLRKEEITNWEEIGFHRQLSGFFTSFFITVIVGIPQIIIIFYAFPRFIMPFPMAEGQYRFTLKTFDAIWLVLDLGTKISVVKYFAEHRVDNPKKAVHYMQIFTFWQLITGVGQFAVVSIISLWIIPSTSLAHFSWFFLFHSMIQFPGFLLIIAFFFQGAQRLDLYQVADLLRNLIIVLITQYGGILLFRLIFRNIPQFGEAFGAVLGYMLGSWIAEILAFFFGISLFKHNFSKDLKISRIFFRIDFNWNEMKQVMKYGIVIILGNVFVPLVWMIQTFLVSRYVSDYSSEIAYFEMTMGITSIIALVGIFFGGSLPSLSEATSGKKKNLRDYVFVQNLRWGNFLLFFLAGFIGVVGPLIITQFSGDTWARALIFFPGWLLHSLLGPPSWFADKVFQHDDKAVKYNTWMWILEQAIRLILLLILVPIMKKMMAVIWAYNPALIAKDVVSFIIIRHKMKIKPKRYWWKIWIGPLIAGVLSLGIFIGITLLFGDMSIGKTIILFVLGFFVSQPLYYVFLGFFGAFDPNSLEEFNKGTKMVTRAVRFMARYLYWAVYFGAVVLKSPFHNRYKIDIYDAAMKEAKELTEQKRVLLY